MLPGMLPPLCYYIYSLYTIVYYYYIVVSIDRHLYNIIITFTIIYLCIMNIYAK